MQALRTALAGLVLLGLLGAATGAGDDDDGDDPQDVIALELDGLRGCGAMHWGDTRPECVRHLQRALRLRGAPIEPTGNYLAETTKYLTEFQSARGLHTDGVLDRQTVDALADLPAGTGGWDLRRDCVSLRRTSGTGDGSQGRCVTALRARLSEHGIKAGRGDTFDDDADAAVKAFQLRVGLPAIGVAGPQTRLALHQVRPTPGSAATGCTIRGCRIVIGRGTTRDLASAFPDNAVVRALLAEAVSAAVCAQVRAVPAINIVCQAVGSYIIDAVARALNAAAAQHACLQVSVGYPPGQASWYPLTVAPHNGATCHD